MELSHPRRLGAAFAVALRGQRLDVPFRMTGDLNPLVTISPQHPEVGPVTVEFCDGEVTVGIGDYFHCHFEPASYRRQGHADPESAAVAAGANIVFRIGYYLWFTSFALASGALYMLRAMSKSGPDWAA